MVRANDKRLRIGIDLRWLQRAYLNSPAGAVGGVGTFSQNLWRGLAETPSRIELVALVSREPRAEPFRRLIQSAPSHEICTIGLIGLWPRLDRRAKCLHLLTLLETDIGLGMNLGPLGLDVLHMVDHRPPPRTAACPTVATVHEYLSWAAQGWRIYRYLFSRLTHASRIVAVSKAVREDYARQPGWGTCAISYVHNGIDPAAFCARTPPGAEVWSKFRLPADYYLHVGVLTERKNPGALFRAMAKVISSTQKDIYLVAVGPYAVVPGREQAMVSLARDVGIVDRLIILADGAGPADMAALYRSSIGLVFPSLSEGFGLPAIECLACGVPCVVSDVGALPEVAGDLGVLVDPRDPDDVARGMLRLLEDESHRAMIRAKGPEWAKRFSYKAMAQGYLKVYNELAGSAAGARSRLKR